MADNPMTTSGTGGAKPPGPPLPPELSYGDNPPSAVTDAQYLADQAALRQQINSQYQELLGQLGYMDPVSGMFIPGSVEQSADIQEGNLRQQMGQADRQVDQNAQNSGILFSGVRGTQRAEAEMPYMQQVGQLGFDTTNTLADLYRQAQGLMGNYNTQNMQLLAAAADRAAQKATANPIDPIGATGPPPAVPPPPVDTPPPPPPPPPTSADPPPLFDPTPPGAGGGGGIIHPPVAFAKGGEVSRPTRAVLGERSRPGDRRSHEVVIPRNKLSTEGNQMLDHLMHMAGIRSAALGRLGAQHGISPAGLDAPQLQALGLHSQAADLWSQRHPYAVAHGNVPRWVLQDEMGNLHDPANPVTHLPMTPNPHPVGLPLAPAIGRDPLHHLAHHIGMAALRRLGEGMHPTMPTLGAPGAGHFGPGVIGLPPDDLGMPPSVPIDVSHPFRAPAPVPTPMPVDMPSPLDTIQPPPPVPMV